MGSWWAADFTAFVILPGLVLSVGLVLGQGTTADPRNGQHAAAGGVPDSAARPGVCSWLCHSCTWGCWAAHPVSSVCSAAPDRRLSTHSVFNGCGVQEGGDGVCGQLPHPPPSLPPPAARGTYPSSEQPWIRQRLSRAVSMCYAFRLWQVQALSCTGKRRADERQPSGPFGSQPPSKAPGPSPLALSCLSASPAGGFQPYSPAAPDFPCHPCSQESE